LCQLICKFNLIHTAAQIPYKITPCGMLGLWFKAHLFKFKMPAMALDEFFTMYRRFKDNF